MKKLFVGFLFLPTIATAQFFTGNILLQRMQSSELAERMIAMGYVIGVSDNGQGITHCSGAQVTSGQTRDVVKQYLEQNPAIRDLQADIIVGLALSQAWPCQKNQKKGGTKL